jgi:CRISPR type III-B/RAMP module-associated protein Cmr5
MKNLEQIRAKNALAAHIGEGADGGESVAKKIPVMIRENGFIAAMAFAKEYLDDAKKKAEKNKKQFNPNDKYTGKGYVDVFNAIIAHLKDVNQLHGIPADFDGFLDGLCKEDSTVLRAVTAEAMAYLNYLRRFQG